MVIMFNVTFNNISVISWQSVLLVEETVVPRENQQPDTSHRQFLSHKVVSSTHLLIWTFDIAWIIVFQALFITSPTKLQRDIVTLPSVRPSHPCEHSRINILQWILTKLGTYLLLKRIWNRIDFQGHRSRSPGHIFTA
jgi:hypothetical protein